MNKAYSYTSINQKWVKQIPSHWNAKRMKAVFAMRKERNNPIVTENILSLTAKQGVVPYAEKEGTGGNKPKSDLTQYNVCHENDLLVNCMNVVSGAAGVSRYYGAISPVYYAFYPMRTRTFGTITTFFAYFHSKEAWLAWERESSCTKVMMEL